MMTSAQLDAKLELIEARMDARIARIEGLFAALERRLDSQSAASESRAAERDKRIDLLVESAARSAERASTLKAHFWGAVLTIILSVGGIALASVYATQQSNLAIIQSVTAAYQQGQQAAKR